MNVKTKPTNEKPIATKKAFLKLPSAALMLFKIVGPKYPAMAKPINIIPKFTLLYFGPNWSAVNPGKTPMNEPKHRPIIEIPI